MVGGLLHAGPQLDDATRQFLQDADAAGVTLVGICTGTLALVAASVMENRPCCATWYQCWDFIESFPAKASQVVADRRILIDNRRITCSVGQAAVDVAAAVLERHFDAATLRKEPSILIVDDLPRIGARRPVSPRHLRVGMGCLVPDAAGHQAGGSGHSQKWISLTSSLPTSCFAGSDNTPSRVCRT